MSSASLPSTLPGTAVPAPPPVGPELLRPMPHRPRRMGWWMAVVIAIVVAAAAWKARRESGAAKPETAALRTATITTGDIQRTIRLSGVVTAERFAALMAPRLRGSRPASGSGGAGGASTSTAVKPSSSTTSTTSSSSTATPSTTSSTSQNAAPTSTNTAVTGQGATSGAPGAPTSSLGAIRGTTNRFGDRQAAQTSANTSTTASGTTPSSTALGASGLGSTSGNLLGTGTRGGTGGGGGGDFNLVLLQLVAPGSRVKKGQIVAEFDRQYQVNRLDDYKATVVQQDANIKKMTADLAVAKKAHDQLVESAKADWDKALLDLKTAEVRSAIEAEDLKLAVNEGEARYKQLVKEVALVEASQSAQIRAAEIERDQGKLELDRAMLNVNRMVVKAPMDGIAVMQTIWRGGDFGQVQLGDQIRPGQTFMQIVDPSSMVLMGNLNQVDAEEIRLGLKGVARLDEYTGAEFPARVIGVGAITKPGVWRPTYMREIAIRLKFEQVDARVIPDLSASAEIVLAAEPHATVAPLGAVFRDGGANAFVFLQTPSGWQRREIAVGLQNHVAVAVRSGVSPGDVVAAERPSAGKAPS